MHWCLCIIVTLQVFTIQGEVEKVGKLEAHILGQASAHGVVV